MSLRVAVHHLCLRLLVCVRCISTWYRAFFGALHPGILCVTPKSSTAGASPHRPSPAMVHGTTPGTRRINVRGPLQMIPAMVRCRALPCLQEPTSTTSPGDAPVACAQFKACPANADSAWGITVVLRPAVDTPLPLCGLTIMTTPKHSQVSASCKGAEQASHQPPSYEAIQSVPPFCEASEWVPPTCAALHAAHCSSAVAKQPPTFGGCPVHITSRGRNHRSASNTALAPFGRSLETPSYFAVKHPLCTYNPAQRFSGLTLLLLHSPLRQPGPSPEAPQCMVVNYQPFDPGILPVLHFSAWGGG